MILYLCLVVIKDFNCTSCSNPDFWSPLHGPSLTTSVSPLPKSDANAVRLMQKIDYYNKIWHILKWSFMSPTYNYVNTYPAYCNFKITPFTFRLWSALLIQILNQQVFSYCHYYNQFKIISRPNQVIVKKCFRHQVKIYITLCKINKKEKVGLGVQFTSVAFNICAFPMDVFELVPVVQGHCGTLTEKSCAIMCSSYCTASGTVPLESW